MTYINVSGGALNFTHSLRQPSKSSERRDERFSLKGSLNFSRVSV